jgi:8-oxo-dGTP pyrophosphatase MutT (NUDIX family)
MAGGEKPLVEGVDYYVDPEGLWVFTADFLRRRGFCCHQGCRHCPYDPEPAATPSTRERASALCLHEGRLLVVRMREPESGDIRPFPPGGGVEPGETPAEAAVRETFEETGYRVRLETASPLTRRYPYRWAGRDIDVTTHFFFATLVKPAPESPPGPRDSALVGVEWVNLPDVPRLFAGEAVLGKILAELLGGLLPPR